MVQEEEHSGTPGQVWYLPHFGTYHPRKPDKIRVVFDCSAKYFGLSLNDHLLAGPDMMNKLAGILCRFRKENVAVSNDIQSMFNGFKVSKDDRNFLRFVWFDEDGKTADYRMTTHLFGAVSSPGCATYGLRKLAQDHKLIYPDAVRFIERNFYVDDGLISVQNTESAKKLISEVREICGSGNLRIHKFISNDPRALEDLPISERNEMMEDIEFAEGYALGVKWHVLQDKFTFSTCSMRKPVTRRGILSTVASIFDPLGWIAPFTLRGKQILQDTCKASVDWDDQLEVNIMARWQQWLSDANDLGTVQIDRCIRPRSFFKVARTELHHFCDGSETGYGACSYLRFVSLTGDVHCTLLMSKARVAPVKIMTIPRLELQAAVLASEMHKFITTELDFHVDQVYFWTDSEIVLGYINNDVKRYKVFVANRVQQIRNNSECNKWNHIPSKDNPADMASRGCSLKELTASQWFTGPLFLKSMTLKTKSNLCELYALIPNDCELRQVNCKTTNAKVQTLSSKFEKFSSWTSLTKAFAILKLIARNRSWKQGDVTVQAIEDAETFIIATTQATAFGKEINALQKNAELHVSSNISKLCPFLEDGILKVGGRAQASRMLSKHEKHPAILPGLCHVTNLIVGHYHEKSQHQGRSMTLSLIRQSGYWIVGSSNVVTKVLRNCVTCKKLRGKNCTQIMGSLPLDRLEPSPPFTHIGVDCFGPYVVKDRRSEIKRWGLLTTCLYSRAVHLEVLEDLTTDSFLCALRRIISIRGPVRSIRCDQGTNFVGADNELEKELRSCTGKLKTFLTENKCEFIFNPPTASHMGGIFERQIRTVKSVLNGLLLKYHARMDTTTLRTALCEVMAIVNSRPLSVEDMHDPSSTVITPNHLLTGKRFDGNFLPTQPMADDKMEDIFVRRRWLQAQIIADEFWQSWKRLYLNNITVRQKWKKKERNLVLGDIVILDEPDTPRAQWKVGIIDQITQSGDGFVRKALVRLGNRGLDRFGRIMENPIILERPIHKLVLMLPAQDKPST